MVRALCALWEDEAGVSAVEYALLLVFIAIASIGAWTSLKQRIVTVLNGVSNALEE